MEIIINTISYSFFLEVLFDVLALVNKLGTPLDIAEVNVL